jgi:hypothetical protein
MLSNGAGVDVALGVGMSVGACVGAGGVDGAHDMTISAVRRMEMIKFGFIMLLLLNPQRLNLDTYIVPHNSFTFCCNIDLQIEPKSKLSYETSGKSGK